MGMGVKEFMKKVFVKLGENNKPTYAVMAIAVVKGIARPIFTMMDEHADPETKKYTAIREFLTEVVAIPTYFACGELAGKVANKLKFDHLPTEELQKHARKNAQQNFMFLGVCTAALVVIPALASITIKPFMEKIQAERNKNKVVVKDDDDEHELDIEDIAENFGIEEIQKPVVTNFHGKNQTKNPYQALYNYPKSTGMKVGGL